MRRCKLISPTNLLLEQPILSPVDECEYFLLGVKEHTRACRRILFFGVLIGLGLAVAIAALATLAAPHL